MISASKASLSSTVTREGDKLSVAEMLQTDAAVPVTVNHISTPGEEGRGCGNPHNLLGSVGTGWTLEYM